MSIPPQFRKEVANCTRAAGLIGAPGSLVPGSDVPFLLGTWVVGTLMISDKAKQPTDEEEVKAIITSAVSGAGFFWGGSKVAAMALHAFPGAGTLAALGINSGLNAFFTYRYLRSVAKVYDKYDDEEMIHRVLSSGMSLLALWSVIEDVEEMLEVITDSDGSSAEEIRERAKRHRFDP